MKRKKITISTVFLAVCITTLGVVMLTYVLKVAGLITITANLSESLPGHVFMIVNGQPVSKGDTVGFHWHGGATYPKGEIFIKKVTGMQGDIITNRGRDVYVNNARIGYAKPKSLAGVPLDISKPQVIGKGELFVSTPHKDSLDSRYSMVGTIKPNEIIGRAYVLF